MRLIIPLLRLSLTLAVSCAGVENSTAQGLQWRHVRVQLTNNTNDEVDVLINSLNDSLYFESFGSIALYPHKTHSHRNSDAAYGLAFAIRCQSGEASYGVYIKNPYIGWPWVDEAYAAPPNYLAWWRYNRWKNFAVDDEASLWGGAVKIKRLSDSERNIEFEASITKGC
jgi:hypothetical protein